MPPEDALTNSNTIRDGTNTEAEIEQAYADYRAGRFGPI